MESITGHPTSLHEITGEKGTLIMFICNPCSFVKHVNEEIIRLANEYRQPVLDLLQL